jgi:enediyne biosynthesis protein E4
MSYDPSKPPENKSTAVQEPEEEVAHLDDAVIGRALRWSIVAVLALAIVGGGMIWSVKRKPPAGPAKVTSLSAPVAPQRAAAQMPEVRFIDITKESGITFVHNSGAYGDKLLPETMGSGVAFLDFDNDGDQDLLFVNSTSWPWKGGKATTAALYRNDNKGRFENVTAGSGLDIAIFGMGAAVGDYDNDGRVDVFITAVGGNRLFHNEGSGKFREVGRGVLAEPQNWSTACAWVDFDNDGDLDLFVGNYVRWSREIDLEVGYKLVGVGRAYGQPMNFEGTFPNLYRNDGNEKFTEIAKEAGLQIKNPATGVPSAKTLGIAPVDMDNDGWMDLILANDTVQNFVFHNQRNGTFREIGAISGIAFDTYGNTRGAMGIDAARYRDDGALGVVIGNFANEMTALYVSQNSPLIFTDEAIPEGIGPASRLLLKFGVFFFDYDLDSRLDVLSANGHLEEEIGKIQQSQQYAQPAQLFWNSGAESGSTFVPVSAEKAGADLFKRIVGRGSAFGDIDGDGDLDVVLTQTGGAPLVLRNDQRLGHHWLRFKLVGHKSNRDAIGAWVHVRAGGRTLSRQVMPTRSYLSQSELPVTIGLGKLDQVDSVEIVWPGGQTQKVSNVRLDTMQVIEQE